jgi:hypothetical protein
MKEYNDKQQKYNTVGTGPMRKTTNIQHCWNRSNEKNNKNTTLSQQFQNSMETS